MNKDFWKGFATCAVLVLLFFGGVIVGANAEEIAVEDGAYCDLHADCDYKCAYRDSYSHIPADEIDKDLIQLIFNAKNADSKGHCYKIVEEKDENNLAVMLLLECKNELAKAEAVESIDIREVIVEKEVLRNQTFYWNGTGWVEELPDMVEPVECTDYNGWLCALAFLFYGMFATALYFKELKGKKNGKVLRKQK